MLSALDCRSLYPLHLRATGVAVGGGAPEVLQTESVRVGWLWVVERIVAVDQTGSITGVIRFSIGGMGYDHFLAETVNPAADRLATDFVAQHILREGQFIKAFFSAPTAADKLALYVTGYKVELEGGTQRQLQESVCQADRGGTAGQRALCEAAASRLKREPTADLNESSSHGAVVDYYSVSIESSTQ